MTQEEAFDILKLGHNVYLTGSAGAGKTYLLNRYIEHLKKNNVEVAVTASTGIAATHMGGVTIHSWSGLGVRNSLTEQDLDALEERRYLFERFQNTRVLIIDEVSMLHHFRLDLVERIVRSFRRNNQPFGGIQVILCGDFFQLPPVSRASEPEAKFIYHSDAWNEMNLKICYLHEQHRQTDDGAVKVLNDIRANRVSEETLMPLRRRYMKEPSIHSLSIPPTKLYTHNVDVDSVNEQEIEILDGEEEVFEMTSRGRAPLIEALKKSCLAPEKLRLKIGARVMFVKNNMDAGYVNGTLGKVVAFENSMPVVETAKGARIMAQPMSWMIEEEGKMKAEITQVPLRLAWAITVHKSQGMSLDAVEVDLSKSFEKGMGYVALSRVRTLDGLKLLGLNKTALEVHPEVLEFDKTLLDSSESAEDELRMLSEEEKIRLQKEYLASISNKKEKKKKISTFEETRALLPQKLSIREMAQKRGITEGTILEHLEKLVQEGKVNALRELAHLKPQAKRFEKMKTAFDAVCKETGEMKLTPVREILGESFNFEELRLARLFLKS
jgi:ATP-dependent exoDNAse (exonuclease V) alpha subunit